jgi:hypothetical protein
MTRCTLNLAAHNDVDPLPVRFQARVPESRGGAVEQVRVWACAGCRSSALFLGAAVRPERAERVA